MNNALSHKHPIRGRDESGAGSVRAIDTGSTGEPLSDPRRMDPSLPQRDTGDASVIRNLFPIDIPYLREQRERGWL